MNKIPAFIVCAVLVFWTPAVFASDTADIPFHESKQRALTPLLEAGLASELKTDSIPNGRISLGRTAACSGELQILIAANSVDSSGEFLDDEPDFLKEEAEDEKKEDIIRVADPLYYWNWSVFHFNDKLYFWLLKPVSEAYRAVVPRQVRSGLHNFFYNIEMPVRFVNCMLQGKIEAAGDEFARFVVNSTEGILGFDDAANNYPELKQGKEDFGQTLASYRIGDGVYIVWPLLGPSTLRDTIGMAGDRFLKPVSYIEPLELSVGVTGFRTINETSFKIGDYETFKEAALEPYEGLRNAYIQNRQKKIRE